MRIRKFRKEDARGVSNVICRAQRETLAGVYPKKSIELFCSERQPSDILRLSKKRVLFVAEEKGKIVGVAGYEGEKVRTVSTHPKYLRRGIGKKLVNKVIDYAKKKGVKILKLGSTPYAEEFYKKCGFKRVSKARYNYKGIVVDVIRMKMEL